MLFFSIAAFGQKADGNLHGQVKDVSGAVIVGAKVAVSDGNGLTRNTQPNQSGEFSFDNLPSGIAHTVSSFGLHTDYHRASDELKTIDFEHMTKSINSMIKPIEWLINSDFKPDWYEGKKP